MTRRKELPKKIAVLMGGPGSERDVSLATGRGVSKALRSLGTEVTELSAKTASSKEFWSGAASLIRETALREARSLSTKFDQKKNFGNMESQLRPGK